MSGHQSQSLGAVVVDNSTFFRMHQPVPVVAEINPEAILDRPKGIISNSKIAQR
jgi:aspartate-semialdehyde dehydrogenase